MRRQGPHRGRGRPLAALLTLLAALTVALPAPAAAAPAAPEEDEPPRLVLTGVAPLVAEPGDTITVRGEIQAGDQPVSDPTVSIVQAPGAATDATTWATSTEPIMGATLDTDDPRTVGSGARTPFELRVPADALLPGRAWGAAPVSIELVDGAGTQVALHTFLGLQRAKEYEPLQLLWGRTLTLPPDHELLAPAGAERAEAWSQAAGEDSRLRQTAATRPDDDEMWVLDPSLLTSPPATTDEGGEAAARAQLAADLTEHLDPARTLFLPRDDADVIAAAESAPAADLVRPAVQQAAETAEQEGMSPPVAWPADGVLDTPRLQAWQDLYDAGPTVLTSTARTPLQSGRAVGNRLEDGTRVLGADAALAEIATDAGADPVLARQRLLGESAAILEESPGVSRTALLLSPRDALPSPATWSRLRAEAKDIPWLAPGSLAQAQREADAAIPSPVAPDAEDIRAQLREDGAEVDDTALTSRRAEQVAKDVEAMHTYASVRADGPHWSSAVGSELQQLTSARWRADAPAWLRAEAQLRQEATISERDLTVTSGDVNFFADSGRLQITVENHSPVELQHLRVRLHPASQILRVNTQPETVTIGPGARQTVSASAVALAAGNVPVAIEVLAPDGRVLAAPAQLDARVRPTGGWIYGALGGVAALLVGAGLWRTVRRRD